jgi:hypothetical protein
LGNDWDLPNAEKFTKIGPEMEELGLKNSIFPKKCAVKPTFERTDRMWSTSAKI